MSKHRTVDRLWRLLKDDQDDILRFAQALRAGDTETVERMKREAKAALN